MPQAVDAWAHDSKYGGYSEAGSQPPLDSHPKTSNTNIHAMEALTELYRATGDATVCVCVWGGGGAAGQAGRGGAVGGHC